MYILDDEPLSHVPHILLLYSSTLKEQKKRTLFSGIRQFQNTIKHLNQK